MLKEYQKQLIELSQKINKDNKNISWGLQKLIEKQNNFHNANDIVDRLQVMFNKRIVYLSKINVNQLLNDTLTMIKNNVYPVNAHLQTPFIKLKLVDKSNVFNVHKSSYQNIFELTFDEVVFTLGVDANIPNGDFRITNYKIIDLPKRDRTKGFEKLNISNNKELQDGISRFDVTLSKLKRIQDVLHDVNKNLFRDDFLNHNLFLLSLNEQI